MTSDMTVCTAFEPPGIRLGVVRGISYGLFGPPGEFIPQARELGAGLVRSYLYWGQVEPEPGRYTFQAVDARPAGRRYGGLGHAVFQLALGHSAADRFPAAVPGSRPARVRRVRPPGGAPLRGAGAVLAV